MSHTSPEAQRGATPPRSHPVNLNRLIILSLIVAVAFVALGAGLPWLKAITPRWLALGAAIWFLWGLLGFYSVAAPATVIAGAWSCLAFFRARRRHDRA